MKTLGEFLRDARNQRGYGQRELARAIGCDFSLLCKIENDKCAAGNKILLRIARQLELTESMKDEMFALAGRFPPDISPAMLSMLARKGVFSFLRQNVPSAELESGAMIAIENQKCA